MSHQITLYISEEKNSYNSFNPWLKIHFVVKFKPLILGRAELVD
jgi:hypothetical protein